jgi:hypothetical protein
MHVDAWTSHVIHYRYVLAFYEKDLRMQYPHEEVQLVRRFYAAWKEAAQIMVQDYNWPVLTEKVPVLASSGSLSCDAAWLDTLDYGLDWEQHVNLASTFFLSLPLKNEGPISFPWTRKNGTYLYRISSCPRSCNGERFRMMFANINEIRSVASRDCPGFIYIDMIGDAAQHSFQKQKKI